MTNVRARLVGATLGALIAFGIGGASLAMAQTADDPSTTTTNPPASADPAPAAPAPHDNANCPNMGGGGHTSMPQPSAATGNV